MSKSSPITTRAASAVQLVPSEVEGPLKPNPPPNLSCRYFTHATETIIWAARDKKSRHKFNYAHLKQLAGGKQMKSVWTIPPPESWEKKFGKHPTQKPLALLERILLASSDEGDLVLDPFLGSGTTLLAAFRLRRRALGCELSADFLTVSLRRLCSDLVHVEISVVCLQIDLDLPPRSSTLENSAQYDKGPFSSAEFSRPPESKTRRQRTASPSVAFVHRI